MPSPIVNFHLPKMDTVTPPRVLFDNGILGHSEFAEETIQNQEVKWGSFSQVVPIHGFKLKTQLPDPEQQQEIDALFTVGRLLREGVFQAFTYQELLVERLRGCSLDPRINPFYKCEVLRCSSPIERSKFRSTRDFRAYLAKGGSKDIRAGKRTGEASQIPFMDWLISLDKTMIGMITAHRDSLGLSDFEVQSFNEIEWFQIVAKRLQSRENFPDAFHLWTAKRNKMDVFLTLEKKTPNSVAQIKSGVRKVVHFDFEVMRPREFLAAKFGITNPDQTPMKSGGFYHFHETQKLFQAKSCHLGAWHKLNDKHAPPL